VRTPRIYVWKKKLGTTGLYQRMWCGKCYGCGGVWQFHFFGATLGYGLEHQRRRCNGG
jgi:hypothetical protein